MTPDKQQAELLKQTQKKLFAAIFGTPHIALLIAFILVAVSLILAKFVPYEGLFATASSSGMSNYHRWLYDIFVIASIIMGPVLYVLIHRQFERGEGRQAWREYTRTHAQFKMRRFIKAEAEGKKAILDSWLSEGLVFIMIITVLILMYSVLTPDGSGRRGYFWIQTWWPINASLIGLFYYAIFCLYVRFFALLEVDRQYQLLHAQAERALRKQLEEDEQQLNEDA
jgi:hypothetical protein